MNKMILIILLAMGLSTNAVIADPASDTQDQTEAGSAEPEQATAPAPAEPPATAPPEQATEPAMPAADVARSQFTTGIDNREPVDDLNNLSNDLETAWFFTEIRNGKGQVITHQWWHDGELVAEVPFNVNGNRWRVWSSKDLMADWTGEWTVRVVDQDDRKLAEQSFNYVPAPEPEPDAGTATEEPDTEETTADGI
jgi:hypothetical protein